MNTEDWWLQYFLPEEHERPKRKYPNGETFSITFRKPKRDGILVQNSYKHTTAVLNALKFAEFTPEDAKLLIDEIKAKTDDPRAWVL